MQEITVDLLRSLIRPRPVDGHKGTFGHAMLIAGKCGMAGASVLAARAAMRSGVGKLTVHIPTRNNDILQISVPEAILQHDQSETMFTEAVDLQGYDALAIGPGLGTDEATALAVHEQLKIAWKQDVPTVIDADALNILSQHPDWWSDLPQRTIITPHGGELKRLNASLPQPLSPKREGGDYLGDVVLVKKGHPTVVYTPLAPSEAEGERGWEKGAVSCPWGNSGMATAGSGDVLTGIIVGLLAQGYSTRDAAIVGVSLHALSGDLAADRLGEHSMTASDIVEHLGEAFEIKS